MTRLTGECHRHSPDASTILKSLRSPLSSLVALTLDIFPDDYDILRSIILFAPMVEKLKLLEQPRAQELNPVRAD